MMESEWNRQKMTDNDCVWLKKIIYSLVYDWALMWMYMTMGQNDWTTEKDLRITENACV